MAIAEASCALECHLAGCVTRGTGPLVKAPNNVCWLQWPQVAVAWAILKGVMGEGLRCLSFTCSPDDGGHIVVSVGFMVMTMLTIMNMEFVARQIFSIRLLWQIDETAKMPSSRSTLSWGGDKSGPAHDGELCFSEPFLVLVSCQERSRGGLLLLLLLLLLRLRLYCTPHNLMNKDC